MLFSWVFLLLLVPRLFTPTTCAASNFPDDQNAPDNDEKIARNKRTFLSRLKPFAKGVKVFVAGSAANVAREGVGAAWDAPKGEKLKAASSAVAKETVKEAAGALVQYAMGGKGRSNERTIDRAIDYDKRHFDNAKENREIARNRRFWLGLAGSLAKTALGVVNSYVNGRNLIPNEPVNEDKRDLNFDYSEEDKKTLVDRLTSDYAAKHQPPDNSQFDIGDYKKVCEVMSMEGYHLDYANHGIDGDPTYQAYQGFAAIYSTPSSSDDSKKDAFDRFLDAVLDKSEMWICWAFVNEVNGESVLWDKQKFKDELQRIWFPKAFEQIFMGIPNEDEDIGLSTGMQHLLRLAMHNKKTGKNSDEEKVQITGTVDVVKGLVEDITFESQGITRTSTVFIGTTPEFELALYSALFFQLQTDKSGEASPWSGSQEYNLNLYNAETNDFSSVTVKVAGSRDQNGWVLTAAHPVRSSADVVARGY